MPVKKSIGLSVIACCIVLFVSTTLHTNHAEIVTAQGRPSKDLLELLSLTGVKHDSSLASIIQATQTAWIRKPGTERWEIVDKDWADRSLIHNKFVSMDLFAEIKPSKKQYDYAIWMGAAYPRMQTRLAHLVDLWQQGVRFNQVILLSGARPLTTSEQSALVYAYDLQDDAIIPVTEADAMKLVYEKIAMPADMRQVSVVVIDVAMQLTKNGALARPTTGDTVTQWMELHPKPGNCLVISNQPYVAYQHSVSKTLLPTDFIIETVGAKSTDTQIDVYLDTIARLLYQEEKRLHLV